MCKQGSKMKTILGLIILAAIPSLLVAQAGSSDSGNASASSLAKKTDKPVDSVTASERFAGLTHGYMKPYGLSLRMGDVVSELKIKPGDRVKQGQVLIQLDDKEEQQRLKALKRIADGSDITIRAAKTTRDSKKLEFERIDDMKKTGAVSQQEWDKAKLDWDLTELDILVKENERAQNYDKVDLQLATLERMKIVAPFDGEVVEIHVKEREVVDPQKPAITLVRNDPLLVEIFIPSAISLKLKLGQELDVVYEGEKTVEKAKIDYLSPIVDSTSDKQTVRLALPNTAGKPSGLRVWVSIPEAKLAEVKN
jgi:RND family efflux transporter MFP subunit